MKRYIPLILLFLLGSLTTGCESFLDEKPDRKLVVPTTLQDFQALLDNHSAVSYSIPGAGEISADNYYLTDADWASLSREEDRNMYTWQASHIFREGLNDWNSVYKPVYAANVVLEGLASLPTTGPDAGTRRDVQGQALYYRAMAFFHAAITWAPVYDPATAATALGIPLRLSSDFNIPSTRATVQQSYDRILLDLQAAVPLLPLDVVHPIRPSRAAAYGLLARTYLAMGDYPLAGAYADSSLQLHPALLDFNTLNAAASYPIKAYNPEVIIENIITANNTTLQTRAKVVPELYAAYASDDLRKTVFFRRNADGSYTFKGSYEGSPNLFGGIASDEMYLTRAEARARSGDAPGALQDLNTLLEKRWKAGTFEQFSASTPETALALVLEERRKELLLRGLRWMDLKRLNREGAGITLTRTLNGQTYTLLPRDPHYALPLPDDIIRLSDMPQNPH